MQEPKPYEECTLEELGLKKCHKCGYVYIEDSSSFHVVSRNAVYTVYSDECKKCNPTKPHLIVKSNKIISAWRLYVRI